GGGIVCAINSSGTHYSLPSAMNLGTAAPSPSPTSQVSSPTNQVPSPTTGPSSSPTPTDLLCQGQACEGHKLEEFGGCNWPYVSYEHVMVAGADPTNTGANIFEIQELKSGNCA